MYEDKEVPESVSARRVRLHVLEGNSLQKKVTVVSRVLVLNISAARPASRKRRCLQDTSQTIACLLARKEVPRCFCPSCAECGRKNAPEA